MDYVEGLNLSIAYIEDSLFGEIDYERVAQIAGMSKSAGHHPQGVGHQNASEHVKHPYKAMMYLVGDECGQEELCGLKVEDAPSGLFLVSDVTLNQFDENGNMDIALSLMKASEAFVEFIKSSGSYQGEEQPDVF